MPLPSDWLTATEEPDSDTVVKPALEAKIVQIQGAVDALVKAKADDRPKLAALLLVTLKDLLGSAKKTSAHAVEQEWSTTAKRLKKFINELRQWRAITVNAVAGELAQNTRTRFSDAGAWAMHYSTVRMTITTFFITTTWAVISLRWDSYNHDLWWAALVVWLFAGAFLFVFTLLTVHASSRQQEYKSYLAALDGRTPPKRLDRTVKFWIWAPVILYVLASGGFGWLLCAWANRAPKIAITWAAFVNESSIKKQQDESGLQTVRISDWGAKVDAITTSLNEINAKLPQPTPTVTPTITPAPPKPASFTPDIRLAGIAALQRDLILARFNPGDVDGIYGSNTRRAAKEFCAQSGIKRFKGPRDPAFLKALSDKVSGHRR